VQPPGLRQPGAAWSHPAPEWITVRHDGAVVRTA